MPEESYCSAHKQHSCLICAKHILSIYPGYLLGVKEKFGSSRSLVHYRDLWEVFFSSLEKVTKVNTDKRKISSTLAALDNIEIISCKVGELPGGAAIGSCDTLIGRYFQGSWDEIYESCQNHLEHFLTHLSKDRNGGWVEVFFE